MCIYIYIYIFIYLCICVLSLSVYYYVLKRFSQFQFNFVVVDTEEPFKSLKPVMPVQGLDNSDQSKAKSIEEEDINLSELTPILVAARNGITEMVETTLRIYPMAMYDVDNKHQKNIVLLTAEHKQPCVYKLLLSLKEEKIIKKSVFCEVDNEGNSALHLAAKSTNFNWPVPGALSQMQWEIKWYEVRSLIMVK